MNSKIFILAIIAINFNIILAQIGVRRAVAVGNGLIGSGRLVGGGPAIIRGGGGLIGTRGLYGGGLIGGGLIGGGLVGGPGVARVGVLPAGVALGGYGGYGVGGLAGIGGYGLGLRARGLVGGVQAVGPVVAAIETIRNVQVVDVPTSQDIITPQTLIIPPNILPVNIEFRSQSSPVNVNQVHIPGRPGEVQSTQSEEEPDRLTHEVVKPLIQEIRETIVPFRRITQEILPVQEEITSLVARGERQQVLAAPQVIPQPIIAAPRVAVAGPAVGAIGLAGPAIGVAAPAIGVAGPVAAGVIGAPITTGITRIGPGIINGGGLINGGLINGGLVNGGLVNGGLVDGGLVGGGVVRTVL